MRGEVFHREHRVHTSIVEGATSRDGCSEKTTPAKHRGSQKNTEQTTMYLMMFDVERRRKTLICDWDRFMPVSYDVQRSRMKHLAQLNDQHSQRYRTSQKRSKLKSIAKRMVEK